MLSKQQLGIRGELRARQYLEQLGYQFVRARFRNRYGEADLVMQDGETLVFVEVKLRRGNGQGHPVEAVTHRKLNHAVRAAEGYCQAQDYRGSWRIDVMGIKGDSIKHVKNVTSSL